MFKIKPALKIIEKKLEEERMKITVRYKKNKNVPILDVRENILLQDGLELQEVIDKQLNNGVPGIVVNLQDVNLLDSISFCKLIAINTYMAREGKKLVLINPGRSIQFLIAVTKFTGIFEIYSKDKDIDADIEDKAIEAIMRSSYLGGKR